MSKMNELCCPQCEKVLLNTTCRIVQDSCGHKKCRICLLQDEENCRQCLENNAQKTTVIKYENCKTAVITSAVYKDTTEEDRCSDILNNLVNSKISEAVKSKTELESNCVGKNANEIKNKPVKKCVTVKNNCRTLSVPGHITVLKDPPSYRCNVCNKSFSTKSHVKYHLYCVGGNIILINVDATEFKILNFQVTNHIAAASVEKNSLTSRI